MKSRISIQTFVTTMILSFILVACSERTVEKAENATNTTADKVKEAYRGAEEEVCEVVNGKMECVAKEIKNEVLDASDKAKTKAKEIKNKVD